MQRFILLLTIIGFSFSFLSASDFNSYIIRLKNDKSSERLMSSGIQVKKIFNITQTIKNNSSLQDTKIDNNLLEKLNQYAVVSKPDRISNSQFNNYISNISDFIQPNYIYRIKADENLNDKLYSEQWAIKQVRAHKAWDIATGKGIIIGVVDTGIDFLHEDLQGQININIKEDINNTGKFEAWSYKEERDGISGDLNGIDEDDNGYADDVIGYDFVDESGISFGDYSTIDPIPFDENNHGTYVSGIISAKHNNEIGISGIAYNSKIMSSRCFDMSGQGESDDIAAGIIYLAMNGADVINCSFGEHNDSEILKDAINFATQLGVVVVASSGNNNHYFPHFPSEYSNVISVGGSTKDYTKYGYGNYGSRLDITAPGQEVMSLNTNNRYALGSGTSSSAPHVSAAVALLIEKFGKMEPAIIKNILISTALDIGDKAWDIKFASGILDIEKALQYSGSGKTSVLSPKNDQIYNRNNQNKIEIIGNIINPLFDKYEILWGGGILPDQWTKVKESDKQIKNGKIAEINTNDFVDTIKYYDKKTRELLRIKIVKDTVYTIAIKVYLKNYNTIEHRFYVNITSSENKLKFINTNVFNIFKNGKRTIFVSAQTNEKSSLFIKYKKSSDVNYKIAKDKLYLADFHEILLPDLIPNTKYEAIIFAVNNKNDTVSNKINFSVNDDDFKKDDFQYKYSVDSRLYMNEFTFNEKGENYYIFNDFNNLDVGRAIKYKFDNKKLIAIDTSRDEDIIKGVGDINGDGKQEVLTSYYANTKIFSLEESKPMFNNSVFTSNPSFSFFGEHLYDFDGDGKDELISTNQKNYQLYDIENGNLIPLDTCILPVKNKYQSVWINSILGDFDDDGNTEICFMNSIGVMFIYEIRNNKFVLEYSDTTFNDLSRQYLSKGDFDGDGKPEIVYMTYGTHNIMGYYDGVNPIWTCKVIDYETGKYKTIWEDYFYGVKHGSVSRKIAMYYQNGLATGDLDGDGLDELVISTFPNLYVFSNIGQGKKTNSMWHFPSTLSNTPYIGDIDGNGINELGFSGFNNTLFFELPKKADRPSTPTNFRAYVYNDTTCVLKWDSANLAKYYQIGTVENEQISLLNINIEEDSIRLGKFQTDLLYFAVTAVNDSLENKMSYFSEIIEVYFHKPIANVVSEIKSMNNLSIKVKFDGEIIQDYLEPMDYTLKQNDKLIAYASSILIAGNSSAIVSFNSKFDTGDYQLKINSFKDKYGTFSKELRSDISVVNDIQEKELIITGIKIYTSSLFEIFFSDSLDILPAENIENYSIVPRGEIQSVSVTRNTYNSIMLYINNVLPRNTPIGSNYTILAKNLFAQNGKEITTGTGSSISFVISAETNDNAFVFPQPISLQKDEFITFAGLTPKAKITVMTLSGVKIIELEENDGNGGVKWDMKDNAGNRIKHGIYIYRVFGFDKEENEVQEELKKFVILP